MPETIKDNTAKLNKKQEALEGLVPMSKNQVMDLAMDLGKILLKSGAETSRVEDTMMRFCRSYGYFDLNVFCTPTVIVLGDESPRGKSRVFRVRSRSTDLSLIMDVNQLSYNFRKWHMGYYDIKRWLQDRLDHSHPYGNGTVCLAAGVSSACFGMLLGANVHNFVGAFFAGFIAMLLLKLVNSFRPSPFWENFMAGLAIGFISKICVTLDPGCTLESISVGGLMPFLPGLAFTNGVRDYMAGDLLSGNCRIAEAILLALAVAVGLAFALKAWYWGGLP